MILEGCSTQHEFLVKNILYFQILTADLKSEVQNILMYKISNVNKPQVNFFFNLGLSY